MKLNLHENILSRTPAFSLTDSLEHKAQELKDMIKYASPDFYNLIRELDFTRLNDNLNKIGFSTWKYFNRAKYRATPYGTFAAFCVLNAGTDTTAAAIIDSKMELHRFTNWQHKDTYINNIPALVKSIQWFQTNTSVYKTGNEYRYIRFNESVFEIASVSGFAQLDALLQFCNSKTSNEAICRHMYSRFRLKTREVYILLSQLIDLQLLLSEKHPNITGPDYFERLDIKAADDDYIIAGRNLVSGQVDKGKLKGIPEMLNFFSEHLPLQTAHALNEFRSAFLKRFENRAVPLAIALDPELGIGYGNLGREYTDGQFPDLLNVPSNAEPLQLEITYSELHKFILNNLNKPVIRLEEFSTAPVKKKHHIPNTFSVLMHLWNNNPVIENAGGCTSNALLGRFTIADEGIEKTARELADIEQQANPEILFFDIAYQAEKQVDNVNRRVQLYEHELPILTWSCSDEPLSTGDILVTVSGAEIILWSKQFNKRMVPRIPSAYNYTRSDLALYRFLCDLQHQQLCSDLNFKMTSFFPGLDHYPRVMYKNVIVSKAAWKLPQSLYKTGAPENLRKPLTDWLRKNGVDFLFKAGHGDQTLCFNPNNDADMDAFSFYCKQNCQQEIYITEALISEADGLTDGDGKKYAAEYVLSYSHNQPVYAPLNIEITESNNREHANILPGNDWLYFEIYCNTVRANSILTDRLSLFLRDIKDEVKKWFFIRYEDPKPHIRLRIQLNNASHNGHVTSKLTAWLTSDFENGLINDLQIKTYYRETARYGADQIDTIESFFFLDSKHILSMIARPRTADYFYVKTLLLMQELIACGITGIDEQVEFARVMANSFGSEFSINHEGFKKLNQAYLKLKEQHTLALDKNGSGLPARYINLFKRITDAAKNKTKKQKLIADIIHMHINRLFSSNQRTHEAILYQYLLKTLQTRQAVAKQRLLLQESV